MWDVGILVRRRVGPDREHQCGPQLLVVLLQAVDCVVKHKLSQTRVDVVRLSKPEPMCPTRNKIFSCEDSSRSPLEFSDSNQVYNVM